MLTPLLLSERKTTLDDLALSEYDHQTQTRESVDPNNPIPASDTLFDGEKS